jgi:hypothetical protein
MRIGKKILAGVVGLGICAALPAVSSAAERRPAEHMNTAVQVAHERGPAPAARVESSHVQVIRQDADHRREVDPRRDDDRRDKGDWHRDFVGGRFGIVIQAPVYQPDFDVPVTVAQVPGAVLQTQERMVGPLPIESVEYIGRLGQTFYDIRVSRPGVGDQILRIAADGTFIGFE